ncbi:hypothetical protein EJ02DRAFT_423865 [Clathrospora elynae]|uniref:Uncharacterized protein n=1 Tax=Clathrospora elynae TaxID=706981 RepID=A0A6A5SIQ3_9PLEO|nr:hypothetical protein EJ02DRAFT_423865 [Clathrospora elynae]
MTTFDTTKMVASCKCTFIVWSVSEARYHTVLELQEILASSKPSASSLFSDFVQALKRAYFLYAQGYEAIQIVQINASSLIRTVQIGSEDGHGSLIPVWQGPAGGSDNWLCMAEIGPLLGVDPRYVQKSEWLACGSVPSFRYSSAWPIIDGKLFFGEETGEDLVDLFTCVCGHPPDYIRQHENSGRYEYNWESGRFLETDWWRNRNSSVQQSGLASSRVGLGVAASRFAHPTIFGHTGYLRGMIVMD